MERLYVLVRRDLPLGLQFAQAGHAVRMFTAEHPELDRQWYEGANNLVVLWVADEIELMQYCVTADQQGLARSVFREADLENEATAMAVEGAFKRWVRHLPLAGKTQPRVTWLPRTAPLSTEDAERWSLLAHLHRIFGKRPTARIIQSAKR